MSGWHKPPSFTMDFLWRQHDVHFIKVKQPYADLLVRGIKDIENRTWSLKPSRFPVYVLIVSSKSKPTKEHMQDALDRFQGSKGFSPPTPVAPSDTSTVIPAKPWEAQPLALHPPGEYSLQYIVGVVRIAGCYEPDKLPWQTSWHVDGSLAWAVDDAWAFEQPIPLAEDDKFQTQVSLAKNPRYNEKIILELRKLADEQVG